MPERRPAGGGEPGGPAFPDTAAARTRFVLDRRTARAHLDPWRHQGVLVERERTAGGEIAATATLFLTGRECAWHCTMCDLWRGTTVADTPAGAIPAQIAAARATLARETPPVRVLKLYNASSFFDPRAVPEADYPPIADRLRGLSHLVVESHPALVGRRVDRFLAALGRGAGAGPTLEVAMGLETVHPAALDALNKGFTTARFAAAAGALAARGVAVRVFLLIGPPFVEADAQDAWLLRSVDAAFGCGASVVSLIPTRPGNGALDALADLGCFRPPSVADIERSLALALAHAGGRGRIFADVWDLQRFAACPACAGARRARVEAMNATQRALPAGDCGACRGGRGGTALL